MDPQIGGGYPNRTDIDQMPETPQRGAHHRRAHSETVFRFPDDLFLDADIDMLNLSAFDLGPDPTSTAADTTNGNNNSNNNVGSAPMAVDSSRSEETSGPGKGKGRGAGPAGGHFRSLSVDADFFEGLNFTSSSGGAGGGDGGAGDERKAAAERRAPHHRHSLSMDGTTSSLEVESMMAMDGVKKAVGQDRLAELALIDPKRAKRILANRQSAARSKERKVRYTNELERKVQTLQSEATTLSAQVTMLQRDTTGLTTENKELKLRLQAMEQQAHLRDALNEALKEEVQRLKIAAGQLPTANGSGFNRGLPPQYSSHRQAYYGGQQTQQPPPPQQQQQQQPQQLHVAQSPPNNQNTNGHPQASFLNFNQRV